MRTAIQINQEDINIFQSTYTYNILTNELLQKRHLSQVLRYSRFTHNFQFRLNVESEYYKLSY